MIKYRSLLLSFLTVGLWSSVLTAQPAPRLLPFQGRLTDSSGVAVADGVKLVQFKIFDVPAGGSPVWAGELHRTTVNGGLVNLLLGTKTPFTGVDFDRQLYLGITVDINEDDAITAEDPPLLPRQAILPVVFAREATDSRKLAGHDWTPLFGINDPSGALLPSKIGDGTLPGPKLAPASVTAGQIAPKSVTAENLDPNVVDLLLPRGAIIMWSGETVPEGWALCDGQNGTPDLRDRFVVGSGLSYSIGSEGGANSVTLTINHIPSHSHIYNDIVFRENYGYLARRSIPPGYNLIQAREGVGSSSTDYDNDGEIHIDRNTQSVGGSQPHENRPPYHALAFIMKL